MKQLVLKDFLDYNYLSNLKNSPNKDLYSFVVAKANYKSDNYNYKLYIGKDKTSESVLDLNSPNYFWEDNENILYFNSESESEKDLEKLNKTIVYRYNHTNKEKEIAYIFDFKLTNIEILNDNKLLVSASLNTSDFKLLNSEIERVNYLKQLEANTKFEEVDEIPFYFDGGTYLKDKRRRLFIYDIETKVLKPMIKDDISISNYYLSEDKNDIYFATTTFQNKPEVFNHIFKYNIQTNKTETLYSNDDFSVNKLFVLNNKVYVLGSDKQSYGINQNPDFYLVENNKLVLIKHFSKSANNSVGSDSRFGIFNDEEVIANKFYFVGTYQDRNLLYSFDGLNLKVEFDTIGSLDAFIYQNNTFYGIGLYDNTLSELYKLNLKDNTYQKLTTINDEVLEDKYIAKINHHQFESNNATLDGFVLLPQDYDSNKKYPTILDIHGGPKTIYGHTFFHEMQVWANLGYVVIFTNPHGSDCFENEFMDIRGKYGTVDYQDIMTFVDEMIKIYSIDEDNIGVTGGSYGGFMTNWIVGHTNRFKVAATQRSISNWISFYGTSDIGFRFANDQLDLEPIKDFNEAWNFSPLKYIDNVKTPTLIIHSAKDYRCPLEQGLQMFTALKDRNVDTKMVIFKEESHGLSRDGKPQARTKRLEEITNWMEKYLKAEGGKK